MSPRITTEIKIREDGSEIHESWLLIRAQRVSAEPGVRLFDSEISHRRYIEVEISRCSRERDLKRDWISPVGSKMLLQFAVSEAQWGAFVSSFGDGTGVPATLTYLLGEGMIPEAPFESRLDLSHREARAAADDAFAEIKDAAAELKESFEAKAGRTEMRKRIDRLTNRIQVAPSAVEFAAKSLTKHSENVVTKARADIEAIALRTNAGPVLSSGLGQGAIGPADDPDGSAS